MYYRKMSHVQLKVEALCMSDIFSPSSLHLSIFLSHIHTVMLIDYLTVAQLSFRQTFILEGGTCAVRHPTHLPLSLSAKG